jgi:hypothetical protein
MTVAPRCGAGDLVPVADSACPHLDQRLIRPKLRRPGQFQDLHRPAELAHARSLHVTRPGFRPGSEAHPPVPGQMCAADAFISGQLSWFLCIKLCRGGVQAGGLRAGVEAAIPGGEDQARVADGQGAGEVDGVCAA